MSDLLRNIISLCDYSGIWSAPYREAGYNVTQIDQQLDGCDVRLLEYPGEVYGILAAPPCRERRAGHFMMARLAVGYRNDFYFVPKLAIDRHQPAAMKLGVIGMSDQN